MKCFKPRPTLGVVPLVITKDITALHTFDPDYIDYGHSIKCPARKARCNKYLLFFKMI